MGEICWRGIGLSAHSLWRNAASARAAVARGDWPTANENLATIRLIEDRAKSPALRRSCTSVRASITEMLRGGMLATPTTQGAAS